MRQAGRDEVIYTIINALRGVTPALWRDLGSRIPETKRRAVAILAGIITDKLPYEMLIDTPLSPLMGETMFSTPVARMLGEKLPSGVVPSDQ